MGQTQSLIHNDFGTKKRNQLLGTEYRRFRFALRVRVLNATINTAFIHKGVRVTKAFARLGNPRPFLQA